MDKNIFDAAVARSNEWKDAIAEFLLSKDVPVGYMSLREQLESLFDAETCEFSDVELFKKLKREHNLHVSLQTQELPRLEGVVRNTFKLCEDIIKGLPSDCSDAVPQSCLVKHKSVFHARGEQAEFQLLRSLDMTVIDILVRTDDVECEELLHWNGDRIYVMSFVPEFDEDHAVTQIISRI